MPLVREKKFFSPSCSPVRAHVRARIFAREPHAPVALAVSERSEETARERQGLAASRRCSAAVPEKNLRRRSLHRQKGAHP
nr:MAG TPA: hypothetical protein [Caudoviricetes sp.]